MRTFKLYLSIIGDSLKSFSKLLVVHSLTLQEIRPEGENIKTFIFKGNKNLDYKAGQYGVWMLRQWVWGKPARLFTVAAPPEEGVLQLSTRIGPSDFKQKLSKLSVGSKALMFGPIGSFTMPNSQTQDVVLVAGGIGITPMRALAKHAHDLRA